MKAVRCFVRIAAKFCIFGWFLLEHSLSFFIVKSILESIIFLIAPCVFKAVLLGFDLSRYTNLKISSPKSVWITQKLKLKMVLSFCVAENARYTMKIYES